MLDLLSVKQPGITESSSHRDKCSFLCLFCYDTPMCAIIISLLFGHMLFAIDGPPEYGKNDFFCGASVLQLLSATVAQYQLFA